MKELMTKKIEDLIPTETCSNSEEYSKQLEESGFGMASKMLKAKKYYEITPERIYSFLEKKLIEMCKEDIKNNPKLKERTDRKPYRINTSTGIKPFGYGYVDFATFKEDGHEYYKNAYIYWVETDIKNYPNIPPKFVIEKLKEAKALEIFDSIKVATLEVTIETRMKDPLLVGIINNNPNRYVIAQWDDDLIADNI
jgi:hypothetical protein